MKARLQFTNDNSSSIRNLLGELVRLALIEDVAPIRQAILRQIALLINKFMSTQDLHYATEVLYSLMANLVGITMLENAVRVIFWISKALSLRISNIDEIFRRLLGLLSSQSYGLASARGFSLILAPDEILTKKNGVTVRLLAKQKVFNISTPAISQGFRSADTTVKPNYLIALSGILTYIPTEITMQEIDTLLPLLLQSLDLEDSDVKAATIQSLTVISQESPKAVEGHISSLTARLLKATSNLTANSYTVRLNALCCLKTFPRRVKDSTLLPYKSTVTSGLISVLDDPKRNVRKEAVDCRAAWLNMDEPESD